jgi:hypothetical protein
LLGGFHCVGLARKGFWRPDMGSPLVRRVDDLPSEISNVCDPDHRTARRGVYELGA